MCQRNTLERHTIPAIYSLWEGFVVTVFDLYVRELNRLKLTSKNLSLCVFTHAIDAELQLGNGRTDFEKKQKLVENLNKYYDTEVVITNKLPTESNVNFKVINNILHRFNLNPLPEKPYEMQLNKLLRIRNSISHGETSIPINNLIISELSFAVMKLFDEIFIKVIDGYNNKTYLI